MSEPSPGHLDLDALADALAGEGDDTGHLASCASCTSRLGELAAAEQRVTAALGGLPAPAVPDDVTRRITAAIDAEPPLSAAPDTRSASVTALPAGRTAPRRWVPAAAAAAVLMVSAAGLGLAFLPERSGGHESASIAAGMAGPELPTSATGTDYADTAAVAQVLPGLLGGTAGSAESSLDSSQGEQSRSFAEDAEPGSGGTGAGAGEAGDAAQSGESATTMSDSALPAEAPAPVAGGDELARLRTPEGLADCLRALLPPDEPDVQPLALDYARYQGQPALAVLLPDPDPEKVAVYVVGAGCTAQNDSLLQFLRVDTP